MPENEDDRGVGSRSSQNYRDLIAWQKAIDLVELVYQVTRELPPTEQFGLTSQMRRCAVSIPSNIAEGEGRKSTGDFVRFLQITHGSLRELETQIEICHRLGYLVDTDVEPIIRSSVEVGRIISGLIRAKRSS